MDALKNNPYSKHGHQQLKICVAGAADTGLCGVDALDKAKELGKEIARKGLILLTGITSGFPLWVAMGAKEVGGIVIGFSPAANEREHVDIYKLPLDYTDLIIYTGFGYPGRDILMVRSADAVICGCGRVGTVHTFTVALEDDKAIGIYKGPWETGDELEEIIKRSQHSREKIFVSDNSQKLLQEIITNIRKNKVDEFKL